MHAATFGPRKGSLPAWPQLLRSPCLPPGAILFIAEGNKTSIDGEGREGRPGGHRPQPATSHWLFRVLPGCVDSPLLLDDSCTGCPAEAGSHTGLSLPPCTLLTSPCRPYLPVPRAGEVESNQEWCWMVNIGADGKTLKGHVQRTVDSQSSEEGKPGLGASSVPQFACRHPLV